MHRILPAYNSDVIVVTMQFDANKYKVNSTYYYQVYYIKLITMNACDPQSLTVVVIYVDAVEFRTPNVNTWYCSYFI